MAGRFSPVGASIGGASTISGPWQMQVGGQHFRFPWLALAAQHLSLEGGSLALVGRPPGRDAFVAVVLDSFFFGVWELCHQWRGVSNDEAATVVAALVAWHYTGGSLVASQSCPSCLRPQGGFSLLVCHLMRGLLRQWWPYSSLSTPAGGTFHFLRQCRARGGLLLDSLSSPVGFEGGPSSLWVALH